MKNKNQSLPTVTICTPTYNRRPFIPFLKKMVAYQTYPSKLINWVLVDDGTDKIEDLVNDVPNLTYVRLEEKISLGKKRNLMNEKATGEIIVYMDDDDYYPPDRVSHAVETLMKNPHVNIVGSSIMHIYFKEIDKIYQFGPYGPTHATAATFAFRKKLLNECSYDETHCLAEEKHFLKEWKIPLVQLDTMKTILVFSHNQNTFDKKHMIKEPGPSVKETTKKPTDFIKDDELKQFFLNDIAEQLNNYNDGNIINKPDVLKQVNIMSMERLTNTKNELLKAVNQNRFLIQTLQARDEEIKSLKIKLEHMHNKLREVIKTQMTKPPSPP
jgi:glycosyltransferase involved in cell wall biosynthesis